MKKLNLNTLILPLFLISCSNTFNKSENVEKLAAGQSSSKHQYEDHICDDHEPGYKKPLVFIPKKKIEPKRNIASASDLYDMAGSRSCPDLTKGELDDLEEAARRLGGDLIDPQDYGKTGSDFQAYLDQSGVIGKFSASEMISPHRPGHARACGHKVLLPAKCRWPSGAIQGLLAGKLREVINDGDAYGSIGITLRNWYRPLCYNKKVGGARSSDHIQARGFDLDFSTPRQRAKAQKYLCELYKSKPFSLQVGIGCQTLHIGVGSPKRLRNHAKNGSRFWTYGSLNNCPIKRLKGDDCWLTNDGWNKRIYTGSSGWKPVFK